MPTIDMSSCPCCGGCCASPPDDIEVTLSAPDCPFDGCVIQLQETGIITGDEISAGVTQKWIVVSASCGAVDGFDDAILYCMNDGYVLRLLACSALNLPTTVDIPLGSGTCSPFNKSGSLSSVELSCCTSDLGATAVAA